MSLEERFYSCGLVDDQIRIGSETITAKVPAITKESLLSGGFSTRDDGKDRIYIVAATPENWGQFDALYPNQDAQTGDPYRRRYPRTSLPVVDFQE